ncbi:MAG TPA: hypothetical protein VJ483_03375, partial [Holophagaceae bacterium]|nr:hypothetical protein [Holophagaceae bacterium]
MTIQGIPALEPEFQLVVAARAEGKWTLQGWFLPGSGTIAQCLADLKLHKPSLSMDEAITALQVRKISLDIDPDSAEWSWIRGLSRVSTPLVRQPDTSLDG